MGGRLVAAVALCACLMTACGSGREGGPAQVTALEEAMERLRPLHKRLGPPQAGDWLAVHREAGQSFAQYRASEPVMPAEGRRVIYVQPLGAFTAGQRRVVVLTAEFLGLCFNLPARLKEDLPLSLVPSSARRRHPSWGMEQVLTGYVLEEILMPRRPDDAAAYVAFTAMDLWPGPGWNFVFGQASTEERVGVWSVYRNGDPDEDDGSFRLCLLRTIETGAHETGHMFGMLHCIAYECSMCGSNSREEADRRPLALCPECMAKVCWATGADPAGRYRKLAAFCSEHGLRAEAEFYELSVRTLAGGDSAPAQEDSPAAR